MTEIEQKYIQAKKIAQYATDTARTANDDYEASPSQKTALIRIECRRLAREANEKVTALLKQVVAANDMSVEMFQMLSQKIKSFLENGVPNENNQ